MSKSIGKRLRGDYAPMPIENNFNKNRRVNYFELFGKNEQSYIEPTPVLGQRLTPNISKINLIRRSIIIRFPISTVQTRGGILFQITGKITG